MIVLICDDIQIPARPEMGVPPIAPKGHYVQFFVDDEGKWKGAIYGSTEDQEVPRCNNRTRDLLLKLAREILDSTDPKRCSMEPPYGC